MRRLSGKVVSTKMEKTVVVAVIKSVVDPMYKKIYRRTKRIKAHSEISGLNVGDTVEIVPSRPYSKDTHFKVVEKG